MKDERIPAYYGMLGQETNGAGGMFKAFPHDPSRSGYRRRNETALPECLVDQFC